MITGFGGFKSLRYKTQPQNTLNISFNSQSPNHIEEVLGAIKPCITKEDNKFLIAEFTSEEVLLALKHMHPTKALGPDGMPALLYKTIWSSIGNDVIKHCLSILNEDANLKDINKTHIVLIPKIKDKTNYFKNVIIQIIIR